MLDYIEKLVVKKGELFDYDEYENMLSAYPPNKEFEEILYKYGQWVSRTDQYRPEFTEGYKKLKVIG